MTVMKAMDYRTADGFADHMLRCFIAAENDKDTIASIIYKLALDNAQDICYRIKQDEAAYAFYNPEYMEYYPPSPKIKDYWMMYCDEDHGGWKRNNQYPHGACSYEIEYCEVL